MIYLNCVSDSVSKVQILLECNATNIKQLSWDASFMAQSVAQRGRERCPFAESSSNSTTQLIWSKSKSNMSEGTRALAVARLGGSRLGANGGRHPIRVAALDQVGPTLSVLEPADSFIALLQNQKWHFNAVLKMV